MPNAPCPPPPTAPRAIAFLASPPSYAVFRDEYLLPLNPLLFNDDGPRSGWPAHAQWTKLDADGVLEPDVDAIAADFTGKSAPLVISLSSDKSSYGEESREDVSFDAFAEMWKSNSPGRRLYLKDFHLCLARPNEEMYKVYDLFQDDWMNAYALHNTPDDYRFLYLGTAGTSTGFHHDVYLSHSWSTSLCGIKRWVLLAPEHAHLLKHRVTGEPVPDLFDADESALYPGLPEAREKALVAWQYPNETMFVPSGWYHSVTNFGHTLSINHNWANASCLAGMYHALAAQVSQAASLLEDLRPASGAPSSELAEFYALVYNNLCRPSWGWSFEDLFALVAWVVDHPAGAAKWSLPPGAAMRVDEDGVKALITGLAQRWLEREEAACLADLAANVRSILTKLS